MSYAYEEQLEKCGKRYVVPPVPGIYGTPLGGNIISAYCPVCKSASVKVYKLQSTNLNERFAATCHGSIEYVSLSSAAVMADSHNAWGPKAVMEWLCSVFEADTQPDVVLAIKYGQGETVKESVK
jgi:hypothetical protein